LLTQQRDRPFHQVLSRQTVESHQLASGGRRFAALPGEHIARDVLRRAIDSSMAIVPPVTPNNASLPKRRLNVASSVEGK